MLAEMQLWLLQKNFRECFKDHKKSINNFKYKNNIELSKESPKIK